MYTNKMYHQDKEIVLSYMAAYNFQGLIVKI